VGEEGNAYRVLVGKPEGNKFFGISIRKYGINIKMCVEKRGCYF
jgi:hypothetical protein